MGILDKIVEANVSSEDAANRLSSIGKAAAYSELSLSSSGSFGDPLVGLSFIWQDDQPSVADTLPELWPYWPAPGDAPAVPCDFCAMCGGGVYWSDLAGGLHCCECVPIFSRRFFVELWEAAPFADDSARGYGLAWAYCRPQRWNPLAAIEAEERERRDRQQSGARQEVAW